MSSNQGIQQLVYIFTLACTAVFIAVVLTEIFQMV